MGRVLTQYRAGVTSDGLKHNKYRSRCYGRGAAGRKGGCDIHAAFDSPTGLIYPAMDTGNLTLRTNATVREITVDQDTGKATGVHFIDSQTIRLQRAREGGGRRCINSGICGCCCCRIASPSQRTG
jgi:choline dehydrogenase-like flavoprotein